MNSVPINLIIVLLFFAGIVGLQVFFSKNENKFLGLILPSISFIFSLIMVSSIAVFEAMYGGEIVGLIISTLLLANIPTIILIAIYNASREK